MCRIFVNVSKRFPLTREDLYVMSFELITTNGGDGFGAYVHDKNTLYRTVEGGLEYVGEIYEDLIPPYILHYRRKSHGKISIRNTQPICLGRYVIAHNGIFTKAYDYAKLLGCRKVGVSDSYAIAYIIEKVGILNFYSTFDDSFYGVIVVYDRRENKIYLLKTSGEFGYIDGEGIYGSDLSYFGEQTEIDEGLYLLKRSGPKRLHKPEEKKYTYVYKYGGWKYYDYTPLSTTKSKKKWWKK